MKISKRALYRLLGVVFILIAYFSLLTGIGYCRAPEKYRMNVLEKFSVSDFSLMEGASGTVDPAAGQIQYKNEAAGILSGCSVEIAIPDVRTVAVEFTLNCAAGYEGGILCVDLCGESYDSPEQEYQEVLQAGTKALRISLSTGEVPPDTYDLRLFTLDRCDVTIEGLEVALLSDGINMTIVGAYLLACVAALLSALFFWRFSKYQIKKTDISM